MESLNISVFSVTQNCTILRVCSLQDHAGAAAEVERRAGEAQLRGQDAAVPGRGRDRGVLRRVGCHG